MARARSWRVHPAAPILLTGLFAAAPLFAHGGQYRAPTTPSPTGPGSPGLTPSRDGVPTPSGDPDWRWWWALNWDRILDARVRLILGAAALGPEGEPRGDWRRLRPLTHEEKVALLLPPLVKALQDRDTEVRGAAAIALGKVAVPEVQAPLRAALKDSNRLVRNASALALGLAGDPAAEPHLLALFKDASTPNETRAWTAVGLGFLGTREAVETLLAQLESVAGESVARSNRDVLIACAAGLTVLAGRETASDAIQGIRSLLGREGGRLPQARALLMLALGKLGDRASLPLLEAAIRDGEYYVKAGAIAGAGCLGQPEDGELAAALAEAATSAPQYSHRALAMIALGRTGSPVARGLLASGLGEGGGRRNLSFLQPFAATGLALAGNRADAPLLARALAGTSNVDHRGPHAIALAILGDSSGRKLVATLLAGEKNPAAFSELALAAGMLGVEEARAHLRQTFKTSRRAEFRTSAAIALGFLGESDVLETVLELLADVRSASLQAPLVLAATLFGERTSVERLVALLKRTEVQDSVRALCCVALGNIGDSRRHPALSALSHDFPWLLATGAVGEMVQLY